MEPDIFTIGHSNHPVETFIDLLKEHRITALADVRSRPYSRMHSQFNRETLQKLLERARIAYVFLGRQLGARSANPDCYIEGKVDYERLAATDDFQEGLDLLRQGMENRKVALMCAEKDPLSCHRTILVARHLEERGMSVAHILEDGSLETHEAALKRLLDLLKLPEADLIHTKEEMLAEAYYRQGEKIAYELDPEEEARMSDRP